MNRDDLFRSFNEIDDDILKRSESFVTPKKYPSPVRWGTLAAGLLILLVTIVPFFSTNNESSTSTGTFTPQINTSDTYSNLPELLEYLSSNDNHNSMYDSSKGGNSHSSTASKIYGETNSNIVKGSCAVVNSTGTSAYHIGDNNEIQISQLNYGEPKNIGTIKTITDSYYPYGTRIFLHNNTLIIASNGCITDSSAQYFSKVSMYNITSPKRPVREIEFIQKGMLIDCWMVDNELYWVTSDGVCACGYSRTDDMADYYPSLSYDGVNVEWSNKNIFILGEPSRVTYTTISVINTDTKKIKNKCALYGEISDMYYGADWISVIVEKNSLHSTLYEFDKTLTFTCSINFKEITNTKKLNIKSVSKTDNSYRMIGTGWTTEEAYIAIATDIQTGEYKISTLPNTHEILFPYTEILWEENRAIICVRKEKEKKYSFDYETFFMFVEFDANTVKFYSDNKLKAEYFAGGIASWSGSPFGLETLIPMGSGIYVRYSHDDKGPGGFEIYDFSDSATPKRIWKSETSLSGTDAFDFYWKVYDENTFGTLKVYLGTGQSDYWRDVNLSWCIYSVNPDNHNAVTLKKEYPLNIKAKNFTSAESMKFEIFTIGNNLYYASEYNDTIQELESPAIA